jgi:Ca2+-binding EF-hand superfamily protein
MKVILEKIQYQWKTIRKSFHDISKDTRGQMEAEELKFYLNHWGIHVTDETFNKIFETLDWDKDGKVSYTDFQKTVGREIHPGESLYFRQDKPTMLEMTTCKHLKCW